MKKPSLKRKKAPTPHDLVAAPKPAKKGRLKGLVMRPLGLLKRLLSLLLRPLRLLRKPFARLRGLKGRTRIVVWGLLAVIVVFGALRLRGGGDDAAEVRAALERYETASRDKDVQTLCDDLLAQSYVRQTASSGLPCEVALRTALEDVRNPSLEVLGVEVNGDRALARVRGTAAGQNVGEDAYTLVHEDGGWRILPPSGDAATP